MQDHIMQNGVYEKGKEVDPITNIFLDLRAEDNKSTFKLCQLNSLYLTICK